MNMHRLGIGDEVKLAFQITTRIPALVGVVFGSVVPGLAFVFSHFAPPLDTLRGALAGAFVAFCLGYSIPKVVKWGTAVLRGRGALLEAWCFALVMECGMVLAAYIGDHWAFHVASGVCLAILMLVNALSTACSAALGQREVNAARAAAREEKPGTSDTLSLTLMPNPGERVSMRLAKPARRAAAATAKRRAVR
jgi:hypothetical protein